MKTLLLLFICICSVCADPSASSLTAPAPPVTCSSIKVNPDITVQDVGSLTGKWYEVSNYGIPGSQFCQIADYTLTAPNTFSLYVNQTNQGQTVLATGFGNLASPGVLSLDVKVRTLKHTFRYSQNWTVLGTDYLNYFTAYSCANGKPAVTILVRNPNPPQSVWIMAFADAAKDNLSASYQLVNCV